MRLFLPPVVLDLCDGADLFALYLIDRRALARSVRGFVPLHLRNACVKFATSEYPKSQAISEIDMSLSAK
jgi:hypothetical protein